MNFDKAGYYFILLLILVVIGFWESYFSNILSGIDSYIHFHAITMLIWIAMLITQAFIIRYKKRSLHKIIGRLSYGLIPLIIISFILLSHSQITIYENGISSSRLYILYLQFSLLIIFIISYTLAIIYRKSPSHHVRYIISTALTLIDPAVARIPLNLPPLPFDYQVFTFSIIYLILLTLIAVDRKQTKAREVFPLILLIFVFFQTFNLTWTDSQIWSDFSMWFALLPLT